MFNADAEMYITHKQDRGVLLTYYHAAEHLLVTSSWDNCLRIYDTRAPASATVVQNENSVVFVGIWCDAAAQQVRLCVRRLRWFRLRWCCHLCRHLV